MASVTYTRQLFATNFTAAGVTHLVTVPAGQLWVVRDVTLFYRPQDPVQSVGQALLISTNSLGVLWGVGAAESTPGVVFHTEMRQALGPLDGLSSDCHTAGWSLTVTGYVFSAP